MHPTPPPYPPPLPLPQENRTEHPIILLRDVNFWELEAILDFIYNGQVSRGRGREAVRCAGGE